MGGGDAPSDQETTLKTLFSLNSSSSIVVKSINMLFVFKEMFISKELAANQPDIKLKMSPIVRYC